MAELKMPEINYVIVAGNLTKDPIFRETTNKTPVVNFSLASNRRFKDSTNQWQEDVCYVGIVAWNKLAEIAADYLTKGTEIAVDGKIIYRTYEDKDGNLRCRGISSYLPAHFKTVYARHQEIQEN